MHRRKTLAVVTCAATMAASRLVFAQLSLTGNTYLESFDSVGSGLPAGWTVRTAATASTLGSSVSLTTAPTAWDNVSGAFKNFASSAGLTDSSNAAAQLASTNRALGIRQTGAVGDPGAAFTLQIGNTIGRSDFTFSFDAELLNNQTRTTNWRLQYAVGFAPSSFTDLAQFELTSFGSLNFNGGVGSLTAIANQSQNVWLRVVTLDPSSGGGNRDSFGINNFALGWTGDGPVLNPRTLTWNGSAGNWETANNWLDGVASATFDSTNPDRAVFSNGALPAAVNIGTIVAAGSMAITSSAPVHSFSGSELVLSGPLTADQSATFNNTVILASASTWTVAADKTITMNSPLTGSPLTKAGAGSVVLNTPAPSYGAGMTVNGGTVKVTAVDGSAASGLGNGLVLINNGTVEIANVGVGTSGGTTGPTLQLNNGGTLVGTGSLASYGRTGGGLTIANGTFSSPNTVNVRTLNASDVFVIQNSIRQASSGSLESFATIHVQGPGRVVLESGGTTAPTGFSGSWELTGGILQIGPVTIPGTGEPLNALGNKGGVQTNANAITLNAGGILAVATNIANPITSSSDLPTSVRSPITFNGGAVGAIASGSLNESGGNGAQFSGNLTIKNGSVLVHDALVGVGTPKNVLFNTAPGVAGDVTWEAGGLLAVTGTGNLELLRSTGSVTVGSNATLQINAGATVNNRGTTDLLSDGVNHVNVVNNSASGFNVFDAAKNVGNLDGTGETNVGEGDVGETLTANRVRQSNLKIRENAAVFIRPGASTNEPARTSVVKQLNMGGSPDVPTALLDLSNNSMIIDYDGALGTQLSDTRKQILAGLTSSGSIGIATSAATPTRRLGYANNDDYATPKTSFGGQSVDDSSILIKYTTAGDADLDGDTDGGDIGTWATNFTGSLSPGTGPKVWALGDWDYDTDVDGADAALWAAAFTGSLSPGLAPVVVIDSPVDPAALAVLQGLGITVVPEPAAIGLMSLVVAGSAARRRRR